MGERPGRGWATSGPRREATRRVGLPDVLAAAAIAFVIAAGWLTIATAGGDGSRAGSPVTRHPPPRDGGVRLGNGFVL